MPELHWLIGFGFYSSLMTVFLQVPPMKTWPSSANKQESSCYCTTNVGREQLSLATGGKKKDG
jgi:hypothetical protein